MNAGASGIFSKPGMYWGTTVGEDADRQPADDRPDERIEPAERDRREGVDQREHHQVRAEPPTGAVNVPATAPTAAGAPSPIIRTRGIGTPHQLRRLELDGDRGIARPVFVLLKMSQNTTASTAQDGGAPRATARRRGRRGSKTCRRRTVREGLVVRPPDEARSGVEPDEQAERDDHHGQRPLLGVAEGSDDACGKGGAEEEPRGPRRRRAGATSGTPSV